MNNALWRLLTPAVTAFVLAGCAMTSGYNQSYPAAARRPAAVQADGKALIVTTPEDDADVYTGHPTRPSSATSATR